MRVLISLAAVLLPTLVSAQTPSIEVFGTTGVAYVWDDEGSLGRGILFGGGTGVRLPRGWGIEGLVEGQSTHRRFPSSTRFDSTVFDGRARLAKYFGASRAQMYAGGGIGITKVKSTYDYPADCQLGGNNQFQCRSREIVRRNTTSPGFNGFAGVRIGTARGIFVRPEFEINFAGEHLSMTARIAGGVGW